VVLAGGESNDVIRGKHFSKTAVVCDEGCDDAKVSSDLDNVDLLVEEAYIIV
jgi:hypothetical protein